jgi:membrane fusion protein (multidrug efflux system)
MKTLRGRILIFLSACGLMAAALWWYGERGKGPPQNGNSMPQVQKAVCPTARVKTLPVRKGTITENMRVYGTVVPAPGATQAVSVPFESQVRRIMVSAGQEVSKGSLLLEIEPSPDTKLKFQQASDAYALAKEKLEHVQQLLDLKLATNTQLLSAKQAVQQAELSLESMKRRGIDGQNDLRSDVRGVIQKVHVQEGAIVPAGNPLVEIVAQDRLEVRLGVEPTSISRVKINQKVFLTKVNVSASLGVTGRVREISRSVKPSTQLVDVFIALPSPAGFLLGESILGILTIDSAEGLIVPRSAVLPEEDKHILYTIKDGHAMKHTVKIGLENDGEMQVSSPDLQPGEPVVVLGNYELKDAMAVEVEASR